MTRIADTIAATLHAHGIRHAFGMPGGEVVTLIDGLEAAGIYVAVELRGGEGGRKSRLGEDWRRS